MNKTLKIMVILTLPLLIFFSYTLYFAFDIDFYVSEIEKYDLEQRIDILPEEIPKVVNHITDYIKGDKDDFSLVSLDKNSIKVEAFGDREILHMADVKKLFTFIRYFSAISVVIMLAYLNTISKTESKLRGISSVLVQSGILAIIIASILGVLTLTDFNKYFIIFHKIFFNNDLWMLNTNTDVLIQMLPQEFFVDIVIEVLIFTSVTITSFMFIGFMLKKVINKTQGIKHIIN